MDGVPAPLRDVAAELPVQFGDAFVQRPRHRIVTRLGRRRRLVVAP